jgi:hypothetical protein
MHTINSRGQNNQTVDQEFHFFESFKFYKNFLIQL